MNDGGWNPPHSCKDYEKEMFSVDQTKRKKGKKQSYQQNEIFNVSPIRKSDIIPESSPDNKNIFTTHRDPKTRQRKTLNNSTNFKDWFSHLQSTTKPLSKPSKPIYSARVDYNKGLKNRE